MGHQCYYVGTKGENADFLEQNLKKLVELQNKESGYNVAAYHGRIQFKKDIPMWNWNENKYSETLKADKEIIYIVVEGNRYEVNRIVEKAETIMKQFDSSLDILPLDNLDTDLFLKDFKDARRTNPSAMEFENDYVLISG